MGPGAGEIQFARAVPGSASQIPPVQLDTPLRMIQLTSCARRDATNDVRTCAGLNLKTHLKILYSERRVPGLSRLAAVSKAGQSAVLPGNASAPLSPPVSPPVSPRFSRKRTAGRAVESLGMNADQRG